MWRLRRSSWRVAPPTLCCDLCPRRWRVRAVKERKTSPHAVLMVTVRTLNLYAPLVVSGKICNWRAQPEAPPLTSNSCCKHAKEQEAAAHSSHTAQESGRGAAGGGVCGREDGVGCRGGHAAAQQGRSQVGSQAVRAPLTQQQSGKAAGRGRAEQGGARRQDGSLSAAAGAPLLPPAPSSAHLEKDGDVAVRVGPMGVDPLRDARAAAHAPHGRNPHVLI